MTTPRNAIAGLSERLRVDFGNWTPDPTYDLRLEAASAIDALQARVKELEELAKELSDALLAVRPLGGSELFIKRFGNYYADPVYCKAAIEQHHKDCHEAQKGLIQYRRQAEAAESRALRAEQERDEAYERAVQAVRDERLIDPVDSHDQTYNCALDHAEQAIRRLAGPEKIAAASDGEERK